MAIICAKCCIVYLKTKAVKGVSDFHDLQRAATDSGEITCHNMGAEWCSPVLIIIDLGFEITNR